MDNNYNRFEWSKFGKQKIKESLFLTLVNREKNKEMLEDMPYVKFLDLAIVFNYMLSEENGEIKSFKVNNRIMQAWGFDKHTIYNFARNNMERLFPEVIAGISNIVKELEGSCDADALLEEADDDIMHMYVLTNKYAVNGSAAILYSKKIGRLADILESDLYIMPSSIHEMIIVPKKYYHNASKLAALVRDINAEHVDLEEQLSDNIYTYDRESGNIFIYEN